MRGRMALATVGADIPDPEFLLAEQEVDDRRLADAETEQRHGPVAGEVALELEESLAGLGADDDGRGRRRRPARSPRCASRS